YIVKSIVEFPDQVDIREGENEKGKVLELRVAESDLGKVIGKQGRTAKSIRSILAAAGARKGERYGLDIVEK
ncbi:MAG: KH domain-containing protein, partial [Mucispirillum sp.]|nr:KH domain-containing protein [Mucispirillum sp.]